MRALCVTGRVAAAVPRRHAQLRRAVLRPRRRRRLRRCSGGRGGRLRRALGPCRGPRSLGGGRRWAGRGVPGVLPWQRLGGMAEAEAPHARFLRCRGHRRIQRTAGARRDAMQGAVRMGGRMPASKGGGARESPE